MSQQTLRPTPAIAGETPANGTTGSDVVLQQLWDDAERDVATRRASQKAVTQSVPAGEAERVRYSHD